MSECACVCIKASPFYILIVFFLSIDCIITKNTHQAMYAVIKLSIFGLHKLKKSGCLFQHLTEKDREREFCVCMYVWEREREGGGVCFFKSNTLKGGHFCYCPMRASAEKSLGLKGLM